MPTQSQQVRPRPLNNIIGHVICEVPAEGHRVPSALGRRGVGLLLPERCRRQVQETGESGARRGQTAVKAPKKGADSGHEPLIRSNVPEEFMREGHGRLTEFLHKPGDSLKCPMSCLGKQVYLTGVHMSG